MAKLTLNDLVNLQNEASAVASINSNSAAIETALENTLSRDGTSPNAMGANLDMNGHRIINHPAPVANTDLMRVVDLPASTKGETGATGATGETGPIAWLTPVAWTTSTAYVVGPPASVVTYDNEAYVCITAHTSTGSFDSSKFLKIASKGLDGTNGTNGTNGAGYGGTSTTTLTPSIATKSITTQAGLAYNVGSRVRLTSAGSTGVWMEGIATSYSSTSMDISVDLIGTASPASDWNISLAGAQGSAGAAGGAFLESPAYANTGGQGDRTSIITVTSSAGLLYAEGLALNNNLVDGGTGTNTTDSTGFIGSSVSGAWIKFAWPAGSAKVITEITWKQSNTATHGTWKLQGSNDDSTYIDVGTSFTLGGSTSQTITAPSANILGYRYYRLLGVSGTTNSGPYLQEVEFKIGGTILDGLVQIPASTTVGTVLTQRSTTAGDVAMTVPRRLSMMHTDQIISEWFFDEGSGTTAYDVRQNANHIVFDSSFQSTYSASAPTWTPRGLYTAQSFVQTPSIAGVRTIALLYRVPRDSSGNRFICSAGTNSGYGVLCDAVSVTYNYNISHANGLAPLIYDASAGVVAKQLNRGGWRLLFIEMDSAKTTKIAFGGQYDGTDSSYRALEMEIAWAACWSDTLTSNERNTILTGVRRIAVDRGFYIHAHDCPEQIDVAHLWGQSNGQGFGEISTASYGATLSATDQARKTPVSVLISLGGSLAMPMFEQLTMGVNQRDAGFQTRWIGPEMGAAWSREEDGANRARRLLIHKFCVGSTYLYPSGGAVGAGMSWNINEAVYLGLLWAALQHWWTVESALLLRGIGPRSRALWWVQGEEDATSTTYSAAYQTNLQNFWDKLKLQLAYPSGFKIIIPRLRSDLPADEGFVNAAVLQVRAAHVAFVAANSSEAAWVNVDDTTMNTFSGQKAHYDALGQKLLGSRLYAQTPLTDGIM